MATVLEIVVAVFNVVVLARRKMGSERVQEEQGAFTVTYDFRCAYSFDFQPSVSYQLSRHIKNHVQFNANIFSIFGRLNHDNSEIDIHLFCTPAD